MPAPGKYPDEVRARAIRLVRDLVDDDSDGMSVTAAARRVGEQLGINTDTLRNWVKQALADDGEGPAVTTSERTRIAQLERKVRELRRANAILKMALPDGTIGGSHDDLRKNTLNPATQPTEYRFLHSRSPRPRSTGSWRRSRGALVLSWILVSWAPAR